MTCPAHSTSMLELHHQIQKPGINSPPLYRQIIIDTTSNEREKKLKKTGIIHTSTASSITGLLSKRNTCYHRVLIAM